MTTRKRGLRSSLRSLRARFAELTMFSLSGSNASIKLFFSAAIRPDSIDWTTSFQASWESFSECHFHMFKGSRVPVHNVTTGIRSLAATSHRTSNFIKLPRRSAGSG